jgi:poly(A) polymerase Pap1
VELFGLFSERCRRRLLKLWAANRQQSRNNFYFFGLVVVVVVVDFILDLAPLSLSFVF